MAFGDTFYLLGAGLLVALAASLFLKKAGPLESGAAH
jgi:DHA2 family multidrug resistance protein